MLRWTYRFLRDQLGVNPRKMVSALGALPRYWSDLRRFRRSYKGALIHQPCLTDWYERGDAACGEYFLQDLLIAQKVLQATPEVHLDVGSRIDGFVAHVAASRRIEVIDIRPMKSLHPNIVMHQANLLQLPDKWLEYCDSVSCLHALEHMGLGRYGDPVVADGHEIALRALATVLRPGGLLYLSVPVGRPTVHFNAHRVLDPGALVRHAQGCGLELLSLSSIGYRDGGGLLIQSEADVATLAATNYALGMFIFQKAPACN